MIIKNDNGDYIFSFKDVEYQFTPSPEFIDFQETIKDTASEVWKELKKIIAEVPEVAELAKGMGKEQIVAVQIPPEIDKKIKEGIYTMTTKDGVLRAVVRDVKTGKIVKHLDLTVENLPKNINLEQIATYAQTAAIQKQLEELTVAIQEIQSGLNNVLEGMQNDRIAQYLSGVSLYSEARLISDAEFQKQLTAQSLMRLSNAFYQLSEEVKTDIKSLEDGYNKDKLKIENMNSKQIDAKMKDINICFDSLLKITQAKAAIYYEKNEIPAMLQSLDSYGKLLSDTLTAENAEMLYQFDKSDLQIEGGTWYSRSVELPKLIEDIKQQYFLPDSGDVLFELESKVS